MAAAASGDDVKAQRIRVPVSVRTSPPTNLRSGLPVGPALAVAVAYLAAGALWIVMSEWVLAAVVPDGQVISLQVAKGIGFVVVTSIALYLVLGRMMRELQDGAKAQASMASRLRERSAQQRLLSQRLMQAEEDTRRAVAKDLHDGPLQALTLSFMRLDAASRNADAEPIDTQQVITAMAAIREASDEIRAVVRALHPPLLAELGLSAAVERHCHEMSTRTGRDIRFESEVVRGAGPGPDASIAAFRIAQESIANAVKHTSADPIAVRLELHSAEIEVDVIDQGPGFNADAQIGVGLGLLSMRERAESVGGVLTVRSTPAGGTQVHVRIPVQQMASVAHSVARSN